MCPSQQHSGSGAELSTTLAQLTLHQEVVAPGQSWCDAETLTHERAIHLIAGEAHLCIDGKSSALRAGGSARLAPGSVCELRNVHVAQSVLLAIAVATPVRPFESVWTRVAHRVAWLLRRIARRLSR